MKINQLVLATKHGRALCARSFANTNSTLRAVFANPYARLGQFQRWLSVVGFMAVMVPLAGAAPATLAWNANAEADVAGYVLKYGKSATSLNRIIDVGGKNSVVVADLDEGVPYFFAISAYNRSGLNSGDSSIISHTIPVTPPPPNPMAKTTLRYVNSEEATNYPASNAFDGNPNTFWHTNWKDGPVRPPHEIQLDLGGVERINGFTYLPRQDSYLNGNIGQYEFFVSLDGTNWGNSVASGTFENTQSLKQVSFATKSGRYIRLRALTEANGYEYAAIAELAVLSLPKDQSNLAPTAVAQSLTTPEETALPIVLGGSDLEGDGLNFTIISPPANGTLTGTPPNLIFTPRADFDGSTSFTFRTNDGALDSAPATVSITVTPVNDAPIALARSVSTAEDTAFPIVLTGTDKEGNALTFAIVTAPANGSLTGAPPNLIFTPAADFHGSTILTFRANDGIANSAPATISITVNPVNDAPTALAKSVSTRENIALPIVLSGSDKEATSLIFTVIAGPANGTLTGTPPNLIFTPRADFDGSTSFTFRTNDGALDSAPAIVSITVTPVNDAPIALARLITTPEDTAVPIVLAGTDKEGNALTFAIVTAPANGTLTGALPNLTFTPAADFHGSTSFTFRANDGIAISAPATISITVTPVNDAPTALARSVSTQENIALPIVLTGSDKEANPLIFTVIVNPANGTLTGTPPNLIFTPAADFDGSTSFTFRASDGILNSSIATINITVTPGPVKPNNNAPRFSVSPIVGSTTESKAFSATLSASDPDAGDLLTFSKISGPAWLTVSASGTMNGTPAAANVGVNQFIVAVSDSKGGISTASLTITVAKTNSAPVFLSNPVVLASAEIKMPYLGQTLAALAQDSDKSDTLTFSKISGPAWLSVSSNGTLAGSPSDDSAGLNSFSVRVADQVGAAGVTTLQIQVAEAGIPLPWSIDHLGTSNLVGSASFADGTFTFTGSGSFFSNRDTGNFCWQTLTGDGEITTRLAKYESRTNTQRVGVTIRESLASNARSLFLGITGDGNYRWYQRSAAGGTTSFRTSNNADPAKSWLRLSRVGNSISASKSTDGIQWSLVSRINIELPENCYIGILTNSGNDKTLLNTNFSNLKVVP